MKIFWTDNSGVIQEIGFDASVEETHSAEAEVTAHPIETGGFVNDHVVPSPERISIQAHVTNHPITAPTTQSRGAQGVVGPLDLGAFQTRRLANGATQSRAAEYRTQSGRASASVLQFSGELDRVRDIHDLLLGLRTSGQVVTVVTTLRQYDNAALVKVEAPRNSENGNSVVFALDFIQMRFATSQVVAAPVPSQPRGRRPGNNGNQAGREESEAGGAATTSRSILAQLQDAISN